MKSETIAKIRNNTVYGIHTPIGNYVYSVDFYGGLCRCKRGYEDDEYISVTGATFTRWQHQRNGWWMEYDGNLGEFVRVSKVR